MIKLETVDQKRQHFILYTTEPARFEIFLVGDKIQGFAYQGAEDDQEEVPVGFINIVASKGENDGNWAYRTLPENKSGMSDLAWMGFMVASESDGLMGF